MPLLKLLKLLVKDKIMPNLKRIIAQAVKEIIQFRRDTLSVKLAFILPVFALIMYGFATRLEAKNIPIAIFNYDNSKLSRDFIDSIFATADFIPSSYNGDNVIMPLAENLAKASIVILPDFSRKILSNNTANIEILIDGSDINNARIIKNSFFALTNLFLIQEKLPHSISLITPVSRIWFNPGRKEALFIVPGAIAVVTWIFPALLASFALVREKEQGTILLLYASSIKASELILGKILAYFIIGYLEFLLVILLAIFLFKLVIVGNIVTFILNSVFFILTGVSFGTLVGTRVNNQMATLQVVGPVGFLGSMLLSGFIYPIHNIIYPISLLSYLVPARYFIEALRNFFLRGDALDSHLYITTFLISQGLLLIFLAVNNLKSMQLNK